MQNILMHIHAKNVFLGMLSVAGLLALPPLAAAGDNGRRQHEEVAEYRAELSTRDRHSFMAYLDAHWQTANLLYQQPELINDRQFLRDHSALQDWLAAHAKAAQVIQANPHQVLWEQHTSQQRTTRTVSSDDVWSLDPYLDTHWEEADALYRDPVLINDPRSFVRPSLSLDD